MNARYYKHILKFKRPSGTSRGILKTKETWLIVISDGIKEGIGECGILRTLSIDDRPDYEDKLKWTCENIHLGVDKLWEELIEFPSIQFGVEMAFKSLESDSPFLLFPSPFTRGEEQISINGLIWMGDKEFMRQQITSKLEDGFDCIKMKIGAIDFETELNLLSYIRSQFSSNSIELRVDANGAFKPEEALDKLKRLSAFDLHSIEQPIRQGQLKEMANLCKETPLPIALDEELIGVFDVTEKKKLLQTIQPQYIILKPSLIGGFKGTKEWIDIAKSYGIGWWITSALESNIGLSAIAQYTYTLNNKMPQGLGTGGLYTNNIDSPLVVSQGTLGYYNNINWNVNYLN
ncbi:o-succinylbenzoate synthase [Aquimarina sp. EL_43]|uniref:o-succinylbenzoate synthase n=1 Tax=Aquimarina TaxID=290174 RepID=UPI000472A71C|nr:MULTISPECIES: o-succinylbenzoate synthase [Aquimarina]MBG6129354.1 o-succinylbenzoate synthase [Aquimarina sp. EL_35]MBG6150419.1 o-succinylbenzoate synthase [Aquimarina sp. EL_32]MBG6168273.1 o-succinylbenzoate synthase [Aquimarina sp. EL_43]